MLVLDASAVVEMLLRTRRGNAVANHLAEEAIAAPELLDVEVAFALARLERASSVSQLEAEAAVRLLIRLPVRRISNALLVRRAWAARSRLRMSDAFYVAASELAGAALLTCDARLSRAVSSRLTVIVVH